jgi:hypothetical protein
MTKGVKATKVAEPDCMLIKSRFAVARLRDIVLGFNDHSLLSKFKFVHIYPIYHIIHYQLGHHGAAEGSGITI